MYASLPTPVVCVLMLLMQAQTYKEDLEQERKDRGRALINLHTLQRRCAELEEKLINNGKLAADIQQQLKEASREEVSRYKVEKRKDQEIIEPLNKLNSQLNQVMNNVFSHG